MKSEQIAAGDIVSYRGKFLALVVNAWDSTMAPVSGRLVSLQYLGHDSQFGLGTYIGVRDASNVEFVAHGVHPDAPDAKVATGHPWMMARTQIEIDAAASHVDGTSIQQALRAARQRATALFGALPAGWVEMAVARVYAERMVSSPDSPNY
jgi:hypothetical protein